MHNVLQHTPIVYLNDKRVFKSRTQLSNVLTVNFLLLKIALVYRH